ncbi:50S ribosomal protein L35 [bacterium]|nr:50S ribosomal protein L35 [bacterium]
MPKMKTHRGAAKRLWTTGSGKVKRAKAGKRHILTNKNRKRKRNLRQTTEVSSANRKDANRLLPYGN